MYAHCSSDSVPAQSLKGRRPKIHYSGGVKKAFPNPTPSAASRSRFDGFLIRGDFLRPAAAPSSNSDWPPLRDGANRARRCTCCLASKTISAGGPTSSEGGLTSCSCVLVAVTNWLPAGDPATRSDHCFIASAAGAESASTGGGTFPAAPDVPPCTHLCCRPLAPSPVTPVATAHAGPGRWERRHSAARRLHVLRRHAIISAFASSFHHCPPPRCMPTDKRSEVFLRACNKREVVPWPVGSTLLAENTAQAYSTSSLARRFIYNHGEVQSQ